MSERTSQSGGGEAEGAFALRGRDVRNIGLRARDAILALIIRQGLQAGDKLPSEAELTRLFAISRPSVREALRLLEQDGLLRTEHGRGRYLSAAATLHVERPITSYESITSLLRQTGYKPQTKLLSIAEAPAGKDIATLLRCSAKTPIVRTERLQLHRGQLLVYCVEVVPRQCLPATLINADFERSLNDLLERSGNRPRLSSASVSSVRTPPAIARTANLPADQPWLLITELCFTEQGKPVIYAQDYHRGDAFSFNFSRR